MLKRTIIATGLLISLSTAAFADGPLECMAQCAQNEMFCMLNCGGNFVCMAGCADQLLSCISHCVLTSQGTISGSCNFAMHDAQQQIRQAKDIQTLQNLLHQSQSAITQACLISK